MGRYVKYANELNSNLLLKMTQIMSVKQDKIGESTKPLTGSTERANFKARYVDDGSWKVIKKDAKTIEAKGMLKSQFSDETPNLYVLQLSNKKEIQIKTSFGNINGTRMDSQTGSVVHLKGEFKLEKDNIVIKKVISCKRF